MTPKTEEREILRIVQNDRPIHMHRCFPAAGTGPVSHDWECDSAYCNSLRRACPEHGGVKPRSLDE